MNAEIHHLPAGARMSQNQHRQNQNLGGETLGDGPIGADVRLFDSLHSFG